MNKKDTPKVNKAHVRCSTGNRKWNELYSSKQKPGIESFRWRKHQTNILLFDFGWRNRSLNLTLLVQITFTYFFCVRLEIRFVDVCVSVWEEKSKQKKLSITQSDDNSSSYLISHQIDITYLYSAKWLIRTQSRRKREEHTMKLSNECFFLCISFPSPNQH